MRTACAVKLSVCMGFFNCGCPNSKNVVRMRTANSALIKSAPNSVSAAELITALMICEIFRMAPLFCGMSSLLYMKKPPPARLFALASDKYDSSLWVAMIISDARKVSTASSCEDT